MGIKGLNQILKQRFPNCMHSISIETLQGKTIVVDASIYMYRFKGEGGLIGGIYHMVSILCYHKVIPIFIFDGIPPYEKMDELKVRQTTKQDIERMIHNLTDQMKNKPVEPAQNTLYRIHELKRKCVKLTRNDKQEVKKLLQHMGISYYQCEGESDPVCAHMVITNHAYACLSEDMDMFLYGCPRVLRYFSLLYSSVIEYELSNILKELGMSLFEFRILCVLTSTDYNIYSEPRIHLSDALILFEKYKMNMHNNSFMEWLLHQECICDIQTFQHTMDMFKINPTMLLYKTISKSTYNNTLIRSLLNNHGFIFI
uniref:XPG N-terminal domain-containing protein n=1 Tax=viral metagenome TaxID=1070528 RepID=A0A6C0JWF1_9ZZZZ